jgi:glycosyltransferase involved in cell wall biosynthesis
MGLLNQPLVSVVVPCLNRAHYLVPTVDSILQQDYPNIECIVVDGGSNDGTIGILNGYGNKITWISEPDNGHAEAINKGWQMSKGEILAWLNADDCYVVPDAVRNAVDYLLNHPEVDVVYGDCSKIDEDGKIVSDIMKSRKWDLAYAVKYCYFTIPQPASFMKRSILEMANWLDPQFHYGKDHELWLRIGLFGKIKYVPIHVAYVRECPGLSQHGIPVSESKVNLTKKFFEIKDLPMPFRSRSFQRRALSNAYLVGSIYAWEGGRCVKRMFADLRQSIRADFLNLPYIIWTLSLHFSVSILFSVLPYKVKKIIVRILSSIRR